MQSMEARGRLITLELFIIDTFTRIENGHEQPIDRPDEVGGAGTYAIIGARMFLAPDKLGMIIDYTPDTLPLSMRQKLEGYGKSLFTFRLRTDGHPTSRAVNRYDGQTRGFEYLTLPLHLTPSSLAGSSLDTPPPEILHIVSFPDRTFRILDELRGLQSADPAWKPLLLWEPEPPCCVPGNSELFKRIVPQMDIFSPNHTEALSLLSISIDTHDTAQLRDAVTLACRRLAELRPKVATIIRASSLGCCYIAAVPPKLEPQWIPAYWSPDDPASAVKVVDPTGAGNAFMGGLGAALYAGEGLDEAILWGTVAASFTIEQDGLPLLSNQEGEELWNGEVPRKRVKTLRRRVSGKA